ncbi:exopolysaccharide production repressor protein [Aminobacter sp. AP02]|uniref:exopolysaccharide production repressor protein n=1 Tax=Aminobacter sp. AP02 TaxID=2135737 RepID=UPI000D7A921A|nr:exopolysaccharide production repressor protein [Aminobacter sp. AP02]PWK68094.1 exopolysaccharide production repressor protein [Aminobacter sp. AP02]
MTLPKFILGLVIVIAIVALWSYLDAASWGVILLRIVICAVILQVGYFLAVVAMVLRSAPKNAGNHNSAQAPAENGAAVPTEDMTSKGSAH